MYSQAERIDLEEAMQMKELNSSVVPRHVRLAARAAAASQVRGDA
jgi:hypothetical protein